MTKRPLILITNDDGVFAPGIKHLWKALSHLADLVVVAPAEEQSAVSLSITIRRPLHIEKVRWSSLQADVWSVNGTPSDCVKLALSVVLTRTPDLIVSGINRGTNAGQNVLYSGTVAAVIEGVMHQIPGIAFSLGEFTNPDFASVEPFIEPIVNYALQNPLPSGTILNVNFPADLASRFNGIRFATQGKQYWAEQPEKREHPAEGRPYYWLGARLTDTEELPTSDIALLQEGYITIVPLLIGDLTHLDYMQNSQLQLDQFLSAAKQLVSQEV